MHVKPSFFRARQASQQQTKWTSDHVDSGGKSSMGVLLDWLAAPGNYDRWRSCTRTKESLRPLADEIVQKLHAEGLVHRTASQVQTKMTELENSYREAAERLASTKRDLQAAEGTPAERNLQRVLERHCRYFALLQPIMKDVDKVVDSPPKKRPRLSTKRKTVSMPVVRGPVAAAPIPPPVAPLFELELLRRGVTETTIWDFDNESVGGVMSPPTPPTPPATRPVRKSKSRAMESMSMIHLEEGGAIEQARRRHSERRRMPPEPVKKRPMLGTIEEIDLEKARVELTLRQLELQMHVIKHSSLV
ncbi:hypothetical protein GQ600_24503 [Phytophthora cactorum]|nr:hypothetical protein GQ600_24503 [Phytophthora cactorum]